MFREDWDEDRYMDWADQERLVRQDVDEIEKKIKERRKQRVTAYMEEERDGRKMDHQHFCQEENALVQG